MDSDEGVSAVVGIVILVAIVTVVSAGVMVLLKEYGDDQDTVPKIGWQPHDATDSVKVVTAPTHLDWSELALVPDHDLHFSRTGPADATTTFAPAGQATTLSPGALTAGDQVFLCAAGSEAIDVRFSFTYPTTLQQASSVMRFRVVAACAGP